MQAKSQVVRTVQVVVAGAVLLAGSAAWAESILQNPGFESGVVAPWEHFCYTPTEPPPEQLWVTSQDNPHSGEFCATGIGSSLIFQQTFEPVDADEVTGFSCWFRQDDIAGARIHLFINVGFDDPTDSLPGIGTLISQRLDSTDWQFYDGLADLQSAARTAEMVLGDGCRLVSVGIMGSVRTSTYTDDWVLVPEPHSLALLGLAAGLLRGRR